MTLRGSSLAFLLADAVVLAVVAVPVVAGLFLYESLGPVTWIGIAVWAALALVAGAALVLRERRASRDLAAREAALAATRLTGHDWVWECDDRLVVTDSGHAVAALLGLSAEQCVGQRGEKGDAGRYREDARRLATAHAPASALATAASAGAMASGVPTVIQLPSIGMPNRRPAASAASNSRFRECAPCGAASKARG